MHFQIGFRLISDCFQIFRRISDYVLRFQIASDWPELPRSSPLRTRPKHPLEFSFRLCQIDFSDFRLASDCFQIHFRLKSGKTVKTSDFRLVQIGSDWLQNESLWIFAELFPLVKMPRKCGTNFCYKFSLNL